MPTLNYAEQYQAVLQQRFSSELSFGDLYATPNNNLIKWINAKTIQIPSITVGGFVDVDRDVMGSFTRRVDNQYETKTLAHDREFKTLVDPMDIDETNMALTIANITNVFNSEQKIPELDKYLASKLFAEYTSLGGVADTTVPTADNVLTLYDKMMEDMNESEVPQQGRILYVTPAVNTMLKQAQQIQRQLEVSGRTGEINRNVYSLDDVKVVIVPSSRMKTVYNFTDGAVADATAKQINMMLAHPNSVITPQKYAFVSLDEPSANTGGKYLYYERLYGDAFIIGNKVSGLAFNVEPTV